MAAPRNQSVSPQDLGLPKCFADLYNKPTVFYGEQFYDIYRLIVNENTSFLVGFKKAASFEAHQPNEPAIFTYNEQQRNLNVADSFSQEASRINAAVEKVNSDITFYDPIVRSFPENLTAFRNQIITVFEKISAQKSAIEAHQQNAKVLADSLLKSYIDGLLEWNGRLEAAIIAKLEALYETVTQIQAIMTHNDGFELASPIESFQQLLETGGIGGLVDGIASGICDCCSNHLSVSANFFSNFQNTTHQFESLFSKINIDFAHLEARLAGLSEAQQAEAQEGDGRDVSELQTRLLRLNDETQKLSREIAFQQESKRHGSSTPIDEISDLIRVLKDACFDIKDLKREWRHTPQLLQAKLVLERANNNLEEKSEASPIETELAGFFKPIDELDQGLKAFISVIETTQLQIEAIEKKRRQQQQLQLDTISPTSVEKRFKQKLVDTIERAQRWFSDVYRPSLEKIQAEVTTQVETYANRYLGEVLEQQASQQDSAALEQAWLTRLRNTVVYRECLLGGLRALKQPVLSSAAEEGAASPSLLAAPSSFEKIVEPYDSEEYRARLTEWLEKKALLDQKFLEKQREAQAKVKEFQNSFLPSLLDEVGKLFEEISRLQKQIEPPQPLLPDESPAPLAVSETKTELSAPPAAVISVPASSAASAPQALFGSSRTPVIEVRDLKQLRTAVIKEIDNYLEKEEKGDNDDYGSIRHLRSAIQNLAEENKSQFAEFFAKQEQKGKSEKYQPVFDRIKELYQSWAKNLSPSFQPR